MRPEGGRHIQGAAIPVDGGSTPKLLLRGIPGGYSSLVFPCLCAVLNAAGIREGAMIACNQTIESIARCARCHKHRRQSAPCSGQAGPRARRDRTAIDGSADDGEVARRYREVKIKLAR